MLFLTAREGGYPKLEILLGCANGQVEIEEVPGYDWRRALPGPAEQSIECRLRVQKTRDSAVVTVTVVHRTLGAAFTETISEDFHLPVLTPEQLSLPLLVRPSPVADRTLEEFVSRVLQNQKLTK